jgi:hypothetical protein
MLYETKINRLQVGVRKNEYASDALDQYSRMIIQILDRIIYRYIIFFKVAAFVFNKPTKLSKIVRFLTGAIAMFVMSSHQHEMMRSRI